MARPLSIDGSPVGRIRRRSLRRGGRRTIEDEAGGEGGGAIGALADHLRDSAAMPGRAMRRPRATSRRKNERSNLHERHPSNKRGRNLINPGRRQQPRDERLPARPWPSARRHLEHGALAMMRMAHRDRERVGGVLGLRIGLRQQHADHHADLRLLAVAGADDGLLHQVGRVFGDRQAGDAPAPAGRCRAPGRA